MYLVSCILSTCQATCLTVAENLNFMAVGFDNGSIVLFRGDVMRERSVSVCQQKSFSQNLSAEIFLSKYVGRNLSLKICWQKSFQNLSAEICR